MGGEDLLSVDPEWSSVERSGLGAGYGRQAFSGRRILLVLVVGCVMLIVGVGSIIQVLLEIRGRSVGAATAGILTATDVVVRTQKYIVGNHPTIVITNRVGAIRVHAGGLKNEVLVRSVIKTEYLEGSNQEPNTFESSSQRDVVTVMLDKPREISSGGYDIDVTVASVADLVLNSTTGNIEVDGVSGNEHIVSNDGTITLTGAVLQQASSIRTDAGGILFDGMIANNSHSTFHTDLGDINLTLPRTASLSVDAISLAGQVRNNPAFHVSGPFMPRSNLHLSRGANPLASIMVDTFVGSINVGLH